MENACCAYETCGQRATIWGGLIGALSGAIGGSIIPGIGTIAGAIGGALAGASVGGTTCDVLFFADFNKCLRLPYY